MSTITYFHRKKTKQDNEIEMRRTMKQSFVIESFLSSGNFFCLLITFANSLDPDQE